MLRGQGGEADGQSARHGDLGRAHEERGVPKHTRSDNASEFIAERLRDWLSGRGTEPVFIEPGSPWENGFAESFHASLRDECLNEEIFYSRGECQVLVTVHWGIERLWKQHSNTLRASRTNLLLD
jgi:transposase InsO family protein